MNMILELITWYILTSQAIAFWVTIWTVCQELFNTRSGSGDLLLLFGLYV